MRKKLIIIMLLLSSLPLFFSAVVNGYIFGKDITYRFNELGISNAKAIQLDIDAFIDTHMKELKLLGRNQMIQSNNPELVKIASIEAINVYPSLTPICVTSAQGKQIIRSDSNPLADVSDRQYFKDAIKGNEEVISEVLLNKANNRPILILATPIKKSDHKETVGVLTGTLDLSVMEEFVKQRSKDGNVAFIIDKDGKILAHPDSKLADERKDVSDLAYVNKGLNGNSGTEELVDDGNNHFLVNYVYDQKTGWLICLQKPYAMLTTETNKIMYTSGLFLVLALVLAGLVAVLLANSTIKPITQMVRVTEKVKEGDLTVEIVSKNKDEIGALSEHFNVMVKAIRQLVGRVSESSEKVAASSEELMASADQATMASNHVTGIFSNVAEGVTKQFDAVNNASSIIKTISDEIQRVADTANSVVEDSVKTVRAADNGYRAIEKAIGQMDIIDMKVMSSAQVIEKLFDCSRKIGTIIDTISDIATQTNLLALNAAIEAARAGDQGRGFAVVAEEVRKLAEQSQVSATEIAAIIVEIQSETNEAVSAMKEGTKEVKVGTEVVNIAGQALQEIMNATSNHSAQVNQIATAIQSVAGDSQQIMHSIREIEEISQNSASQTQEVSALTQEQSASMEEIAEASQELAKMAQDLHQVINKFTV